MENKKIIEKVKNRVMEMKGVCGVFTLDADDLENIKEQEKKAEDMTLMGLGKGDNQGVKEVINRDVVMVFTTNKEFEWPCSPQVILMKEGEKIGEEMDDTEKLKEYEETGDALVIGNIVIYDKSSISSLTGTSKPLVVVMPPKECPTVEEVPEINDVVLGSPSPPTDEYLKDRMEAVCESGMGSFLLGFNIK
ncbi:conserved hypothetical protein [Methanohalobium evestigatum Z-7303]|uniref:Uncharacterized protein n=1 Tax=Methanohalobium evestigatum (strain ATCC BAA-1072 / DSM 3721 / NBRC 107634 / OCM 161 / Z-7303) TaxID=644295 RepID=D7EAB3_METEZ|nr:hypothetical protein [Methanohalobium evestigatum]ADI74784.1 conserved hypothetical protein [Methanohalobium evestigatum Z-7303]